MSDRCDVIDLARSLIALDTSNPPGRELAAAQLIADYLEQHGVRSEVVPIGDGRANLLARVPGGAGPKLSCVSAVSPGSSPPARSGSTPSG